METIATKITLINIKAKPYDFIGEKDGKQIKGISYKATLTGGEDVFVVKTDESVYKDAGECKNQVGNATIEIKRNEVTGIISMFLKKFDWQ